MKSNRLYYSFFVILLFFCSHFCYSQKQGNIWYFGQNAGLDFNSGVPVSINGSKMNTMEGVATLSDENGQLLFYTDGSNIWNKNHNIMPGGTGLYGHESSTQSAIIVPKPGSSLIYYVFTVDAQAGPNGLCYSIVNMSLDGGLGAVEAKNRQLLTPVCEKITAVKHRNDKDIWVLTNEWNSNAIYAYLVTENGINTVPVISKAGRMITVTPEHDEAIGYLKASPDGTKLAAAHGTLGVDLMDFDNSTGDVSNKVELNIDYCYGVEFSPNSSLLYTTSVYPGLLVQYEITFSNALDINNSRKVIDSFSDDEYYRALQIAPDGKIYIAVIGRNYLGSINNPDKVGAACSFVKNAVSLVQNRSEFGLPSFIQSYFKKEIINVISSCESQEVHFIYDKPENLNSVKWDFGDPASDINNTSTLLSPSHFYSSPGDYTVNLIRYFSNLTDTLFKQVWVDSINFSLGNDTTICNANSFEIKSALNGNFNYLWQNNSLAPSFNATEDGEYWVEITRVETGCKSRDSINIRFSKSPQVSLDENIFLCEGKEKLLVPQVQDTTGVSYLWQDGSTNADYLVTAEGDYSVTLSNACGFVTRLVSVIKDELYFSLGNDTTICNANSFVIKPPLSGNFNYLWQNNSSAPSFNATGDGQYWVEVTRVESGCKSRDSINIRFSKNPQVSLDENVVLCEGKEKLLVPQVQDATGVSYLWQDGSTNADFLVTTEGNYSVSLSNDCGTVTKKVSVKKLECKIFVPTAFTPNGDGLNDYFKVISGLEITKFDFIVFNRWGQKVFQTNDINKGWDGFFQGKLISGVYVWVMNYSTQDVNNQQLKGTVTLIK